MSWKWHGLGVLLAVLLAVILRKKSSRTPVMIWVVTPDSTGLQHDAIILERFLESSKTTLLSQAPPPPANDHSCVYLYLEVSPMNLPPYAHPGWNNHHKQSCRVALMVNTDQFTTELLETDNLELILCKTRQCVEWVDRAQRLYRQTRESTSNKPQPPVPIVYIGFTSEIPSPTATSHDTSSLARFDKFLHVAGKSPHKGTMSIVQAWIQHSEWPTLTLTSFHNPAVSAILTNLQQRHGLQRLPPNIEHFNYKLNKTQMANILRSHGVHLCPSGMEGFGHYINEGRAVGALVVTTDYPAMNEIVVNETIGILVQPTELLPWHNGLPYAHVDADAIAHTMTSKILSKSRQERADIGARARRAFHHDEAEFAKRARHVYCYFCKCKGIMVKGAESPACAENACGLQLE